MGELEEKFLDIANKVRDRKGNEKYPDSTFIKLFVEDGDMIWTASKVADEVGCSHATARRRLDRLNAAGVLHMEIVSDKTKVYTVNKISSFPHTRNDLRELINFVEEK